MKLLNIIALCLLATSAGAQNVKIIVNNDEKVQRQEVVEVCAKQLYQKMGISYGSPVIVKNALGQQGGYQLTHDSLLLVDASVRPCGTAEFSVEKGTPRQPKKYVTGRQYPERVDDIAWENDRTAYRIYGPALQRNKERAFGVDVWVKNTPDLEVEKRYVTELSNHSAIEALKKEGKTQEALDMEEATTYHFDHGYGLDCYKVGPTLGGGAPALWYDGLTEKRDLAAGIVVHPEDTETMHLASNMALYADPTDNPTKQNFQIFVGLLFPEGID